MNIVVIGSGYVGLVTGCCLAEAGNRVICVDHDSQKVAALRSGRVPFYEPELDGLLQSQIESGRLSFETRIARAMPNADVVFLAVGTPPLADGNANLDNLLSCTRELASTAFKDGIVVIKSTVPVGTGDLVEHLLNEGHRQHTGQPLLQVVSNPEFLAEGRAVHDFRFPDRVVIGSEDAHAIDLLTRLYQPFLQDSNALLVMDRRSAEFAKYACNAMLAARISMVNELAAIAGKHGADMKNICKVLKTDPRIGSHYLSPGIGYGGSCLPKDLHALVHAAQSVGEPAQMLRSVQAVNVAQADRMLQAIIDHFDGDLTQRRIALWGLSFKPGTDDIRAAPSLALIQGLYKQGAQVIAYDPVATGTARAVMNGTVAGYANSAMEAAEGADALVLMTEWQEFRNPDFKALARQMRNRIIFDARNFYETEALRRNGFAHFTLSMAAPTSPKNAQTYGAARRQTTPWDANPDDARPL